MIFSKNFASVIISVKDYADISVILVITFEPEYDRIVIHGKNSEYDYYYKIKKIKQAGVYIAALYELETSEPLKKVIILKDITLKTYVITKEEK